MDQPLVRRGPADPLPAPPRHAARRRRARARNAAMATTPRAPAAPTSSTHRLARRLGYLSLGLGIVELLATRHLARALGMEGREALIRAYGMREMATGIGILASSDPTPFVWGRVAGDTLDIATLGAGLWGDNPRKGGILLALASVLGVTAVDLVCGEALQTDAGRSPPRDFSDRSGFPDSPDRMRGTARDAVAMTGRIPDHIARHAQAG